MSARHGADISASSSGRSLGHASERNDQDAEHDCEDFVSRVRRDESGAALVLAIAFLVIVGGIVAAGLSSLTSGLNDRNILDSARQREYSAESAIDVAIANVRGMA